jgi:site-specific DNA-methyltransferase (adenine-specific)
VSLPAPFYQDASCTIYNADCREILPLLDGVDITVSSPPYNTIAATSATGLMAEHNHKQNQGYDGYADDMPEDEYQQWMRQVFSLCRDVSKGLVWINHKTRFRDKEGIHPLQIFPWPFYSEVVWDRNGSITLNAKKFAPSHEFIYGFGVPHYWDNASNILMTVWQVMPERNIKSHPCPFPLPIARRCVAASCPKNGIVLDPFMGSGTTLVAAKLEGRKSVGIEINKKYCEAAASRLRQSVFAFEEAAP